MINVIENVSNRKLSFKIAHITDIHLKPITICLDRIPVFLNQLAGHDIDYIFLTGDLFNYNVPGDDINQVIQFVADCNAIAPTFVVRGNHDGDLVTIGTNEQIGMPPGDQWYFRDVHEKWRMIGLYSQGGQSPPNPSATTNYTLGATQRQWFIDTLAATPAGTNVVVLSHVPIVGIAPMMWYLRQANTWNALADMHKDSKDILDILKASGKVRLCLSGHEHTIDRVEHEGVIFLCSGAVCANWWNDTTYQEKGYPAGYRLIDFYDDGTIREKFMTY